MVPPPLPPTPASLVAPGGGLAHGLTRGALTCDPVRAGPATDQHVRRWLYAGAAGPDVAVGAAVVDPLPRWLPVAVAFAWAWVEGEVVTWDRRLPRARCAVGAVPGDGAHARRGLVSRQDLVLGADGSLRLRLRLPDGRWLTAHVTTGAAEPAVLATTTPGGGWNVTQKLAGAPARGRVALGGRGVALEGGAWTDWTAGRQDRDTTWRWAAGVGTGPGEQQVGLNASTGMNAAGDGEDLVWWDGVPHRLEVDTLAPEAETTGTWTVAGPGWSLAFHAVGVRAADEDLRVVRSHYVQPIGRFRGTLPGPDGRPRRVELVGVTEDHRARW